MAGLLVVAPSSGLPVAVQTFVEANGLTVADSRIIADLIVEYHVKSKTLQYLLDHDLTVEEAAVLIGVRAHVRGNLNHETLTYGALVAFHHAFPSVPMEEEAITMIVLEVKERFPNSYIDSVIKNMAVYGRRHPDLLPEAIMDLFDDNTLFFNDDER